MARFGNDSNTRTRGNYRHGYKVCYIGKTAQAAAAIATEQLSGNPHKHLRKISQPEKLPNGQYRVFIT